MHSNKKGIILSGLSDEAGPDIESQIAVHQELGWNHMELRLVDGKNVAGELSEAAFERVAGSIEQSEMEVTCFASAIGNWSRHIRDDFSVDRNELKNTIPRMNRLGVKYIRTMSWLGDGVDDDDWRDEVFRRYRELVAMAADGGVLLAHENCTGWGGLSVENSLRLLDTINSPNLVPLFDIGNTISHGQDPWEFYTGLKSRIRYIHVKDCQRNTEAEGGRSSKYSFPGEGDAMVREILSDAVDSGYEGVISIEPHVEKVVHDSGKAPSVTRMRESYLKYGRMLEKILN